MLNLTSVTIIDMINFKAIVCLDKKLCKTKIGQRPSPKQLLRSLNLSNTHHRLVILTCHISKITSNDFVCKNLIYIRLLVIPTHNKVHVITQSN